jgi:hypothetical protein
MNLADFDLETSLEDLTALLERGPAEPSFTLSANRFHVHKAKAEDKASRRGIKAYIKPENALAVLQHLPENPSDRTHCAFRGDFVLCDLIPAIIALRGRCPHLTIATLGLSAANADALGILRARDLIGDLTIICSHYFAQVDKATTYREIVARLEGLATIITTRCHAKIICLPTASGDSYVLEGSANLRSSDNTEQVAIFNDAELLAFHCAWLTSLS